MHRIRMVHGTEVTTTCGTRVTRDEATVWSADVSCPRCRLVDRIKDPAAPDPIEAQADRRG